MVTAMTIYKLQRMAMEQAADVNILRTVDDAETVTIIIILSLHYRHTLIAIVIAIVITNMRLYIDEVYILYTSVHIIHTYIHTIE